VPKNGRLCKQPPRTHLLRYLTIAYTVGPRKGELLKLEWSDVDMRRLEFTLRKTKNVDTRVVPMTADVFDTFMALHRERRLDTPKVFLYKGKPWKNPLHELRHTASSNLRRAGVDTMTAMKIVGHKSEQMHRRHNAIQPEALHEAAAKLEKYTANTVITLASHPIAGQSVSGYNSNIGA